MTLVLPGFPLEFGELVCQGFCHSAVQGGTQLIPCETRNQPPLASFPLNAHGTSGPEACPSCAQSQRCWEEAVEPESQEHRQAAAAWV